MEWEDILNRLYIWKKFSQKTKCSFKIAISWQELRLAEATKFWLSWLHAALINGIGCGWVGGRHGSTHYHTATLQMASITAECAELAVVL